MSSSSAAKRQTAGADKRRAPDVQPDAPVGYEIPERAWVIASIVILMLATALRVYALDLKPLHHDEGVNGFFLTNLVRQHVYHYDPSNYHGPTLYYLTLPFVSLFGLATFAVRSVTGGGLPPDYSLMNLGLTTFAIRSVTAVFGIATVWLVLALRRYIGAVGALAAAALVAVSPACVFYSRYYIHESLFVFFTLAIVVAALRFYETGAAQYLFYASASAALLFATKETAFISVGTLALAALFAHVWVKAAAGGGKSKGSESVIRIFFGDEQSFVYLAGAVVLFAFVWILFYSSFFTNWQGVFWDSFKAFDLWGKTGMSDFHEKPFDTYLRWLLKEESPILALSCAGTFVALFERRKNRFAVFAGAWGFGLLVAYSIIKYKTPWLVLNFVVPLAIVGGYMVEILYRRGRDLYVPAAFLAVALAVSTYQSVVVNFIKYDDDRYPYVYSHTVRQALDLVREIKQLGDRAGTKEPGLAISSPDYWPLPWYFNDDSHAGYAGRVEPYYDPKTTLAVIGREDQLPQLQRTLGEAYERVGDIYHLRPGVNLVLFERRDLAPR